MCKLHRMTDDLDPLFAALTDLVVARSVPFPDLVERLKAHTVAAAMDRIDGKPTDSRLAVMTGLQRRDVARLRAFEAKPSRPTPMARLISLWRTDARYSEGGVPRQIPRAGPCPSFDHLARMVRQDVHPRTLLDALETEGMVAVTEEEVCLLKDAYLPRGGSEDQIAYLAANVGDHLRAATANVDGKDPPFFDRALHYSGLTEGQTDALQTEFSARIMAILEELRDRAEEMKESNSHAAGPGADFRVRLGAYGYSRNGETP